MHSNKLSYPLTILWLGCDNVAQLCCLTKPALILGTHSEDILVAFYESWHGKLSTRGLADVLPHPLVTLALLNDVVWDRATTIIIWWWPAKGGRVLSDVLGGGVLGWTRLVCNGKDENCEDFGVFLFREATPDRSKIWKSRKCFP